jgi:diamine N-acetyltransferase
MVYYSEKIALRAPEPEDLDLLYQWENDPEIWKVSNTITPFSRYILSKYIESAHIDIYQARQLRLMIDIITEKEKAKTVGAIDIFDFEPFHLRAGIGILIGDKSARRKGYATKALEQVIQYAFETLQLNQLYCNINVDNKKSLILFENQGFKRVGIKKDWNKSLSGFVDEVLLQLINPNSSKD